MYDIFNFSRLLRKLRNDDYTALYNAAIEYPEGYHYVGGLYLYVEHSSLTIIYVCGDNTFKKNVDILVADNNFLFFYKRKNVYVFSQSHETELKESFNFFKRRLLC